MHRMSNLEYSFLVKELSGKLESKHLSKVRKVAENVYRMKIGTSEIVCEPGVRMHGTKYMEEPQKDRLVEKIEKELDNARLLSIEQINNDRILAFNFNKGKLIFEMFGKGNIILVRDGQTVAALKYESWSDREIKAGRPYNPPGTRLSEKLEPSEKYIIVSLTRLALGKEYALEALARAGIDEKTPGSSLSKDQLRSIEDEISKIRASAKPYLFFDEGKASEFSLAMLSALSKLEAKEMPSLSEAADEYYHSLEAPNVELEKLQRRLEKQRASLEKLIQEEKELRAKGDYIYEHYSEVQKVIENAKKGEGKLDKKEKTVEADI